LRQPSSLPVRPQLSLLAMQQARPLPFLLVMLRAMLRAMQQMTLRATPRRL
jgi:hypothetical protein